MLGGYRVVLQKLKHNGTFCAKTVNAIPQFQLYMMHEVDA